MLLVSFQQCQGQTQRNDVNQKLTAEVVCAYVRDSLPGYDFVTKSEEDNNAYCLKMEKESSFYCVSDFDGDNVSDVALLLRNASNKVCLFVLKFKNDNVVHYFVDCFGIWEGKITELKIAVEPSGLWEAVDGETEVPFDGIIVDDLRESLTKAYYWDGEKFVKFLYD